jgi:hypothetical protein
MSRAAIIATVLASATSARADTAQLAGDGAFTPGILRANAGDDRGFAVAATGYSGASDRAQLDVLGEVRIWNRLRAVVQIQDAFRDSARTGPRRLPNASWSSSSPSGSVKPSVLNRT